MVALTNNQILIGEYLKQEFSENGNYSTESSFFEYFASSEILKDYDLSSEEIENGVLGAGNDGGCDAIYIFLNDILMSEESIENLHSPRDSRLDLVIIQAKKTTTCGEDAIMKWKTISENLFQFESTEDYSIRYNTDVLAKYQLFRDLHIKLIRSRLKLNIYYHYCTLSSDIHPNVQAQAVELKSIVNRLLPAASVTVCFEGADWLMNSISTSTEHDYNLILAEVPITIGKKKDYVALVNLSNYYSFITDSSGDLRKYIFESNVRDYQGHNSVNNDIQDTLASKSDEDFWWLNNGITILATDVVQNTGKSLILTDPEVVNGLQTSTEIYNYYRETPNALIEEGRNVLVRVIVPEDEASRDKIILATNSQTNIPKSSLRATDPIHWQIEMFFKGRGLYYDRRKNFYKNQGKKTCDIVSVSFLAQCLMTLLLQKPDYARARPSTLLNDESAYNQLYVTNTDLTIYYKCAILGKKVEREIRKTDLGTTAKSDILFYVLYFSVANFLGKSTISFDDIKELDYGEISDSLISEAINTVYTKFVELGGTSMVAKGSGLATALKVILDNLN